jgi:hypothetical protein
VLECIRLGRCQLSASFRSSLLCRRHDRPIASSDWLAYAIRWQCRQANG